MDASGWCYVAFPERQAHHRLAQVTVVIDGVVTKDCRAGMMRGYCAPR